MKHISRAVLAMAAGIAILGSNPAMAQAPANVVDGVLVGPTGMTLYTFANDVAGSGKSACNGGCATNWPPLMATESDKAMGDFSVIKRDDGRMQWAVKGKPVYYWVKDAKPGDKTGDGFNKVWDIAKP